MKLNIRHFLIGGLALLCSPISSIQAATELSDEKPNIIFILVDDMGWSDIGCYGGEIATPNLDRLAREGMRFTSFHNTSKCSPSRACLLTGLYAQQCGMDVAPKAIRNGVTLGDVLRSAGYATYAAGKHHSTQNLVEIGFDRYFGLRDGAANHFNPGNQREGEPVPGDKHPPGGKPRTWCIDEQTLVPYTPPEKDFYSTDAFTNYALDNLTQNPDKPFFLYLAYTAPHDPLQAWPDDIAKYENRYLEGWEKLRTERYQRQIELGLVDPKTMPLSPSSYKDWESFSPDEQRVAARKMAVYAAMIDRIDQNIGRLLKRLEELGQADRTLILFASDNGCSAEIPVPQNSRGEIGSMTCWSSLGGDWANASNTPFRYYKNSSYEGGTNTPFIAHWPGVIPAGKINRQTAHFIDVMPTLLEITRATYPERMRDMDIIPYAGESLLPLLRGGDELRTKPLFFAWAQGSAVIEGNWKLACQKDRSELFDLSTDATETRDLSDQYPQEKERLTQLLNDWRASTRRPDKT